MPQEVTAATEPPATKVDLSRGISEIDPSIRKEMLFQHIRTGRDPVTIYSVLTGEPLVVPINVARSAWTKKLPDGRWMFTDDPKEAPEYQPGEFRCFLHPESAERKSGLLAAVGLAGKVCSKGNLSSAHSATIHAQHRHKQEWGALEGHMADEERRTDRDRQEKQLEATLSLARGGSEPLEDCLVEGCEYRGTAKQMRGHKMGAHKEVK